MENGSRQGGMEQPARAELRTEWRTQIMAESISIKGRSLTPEELDQVTGGADYSYAYEVIGEAHTSYISMIKQGMDPDEAQAIVKATYWDKIVEICMQYPDDCGVEKQAQVIFMFIIGS